MEEQKEPKNGTVAHVALPEMPRELKILGQMTAEEQLRVQNISLRHENISLRKERLQTEALSIRDEENQLKVEAQQLKLGIATKYNTPPEKIRFRQDGGIEEVMP